MFDPFEYPDEVLDELFSPYFEEQLDDYSEYNDKILPIAGGTRTHEEIKNYQQSLAKSSGETIPTKSSRVWWIYAESKGKHKKPTKNSGKWLLFCPPEHIDAAWEQIKDATERGLLGAKSKVSTLKGFRGKEYVICVYTYNWKDEEDVMKVREVLRDLGFEKSIPYKSDEDTILGKYEATGHKNISKYFI